MHHVIVEANLHRFTLLAAARLAAGCVGTVGQAGVSSEGGETDLVYAAPGVQVIADYRRRASIHAWARSALTVECAAITASVVNMSEATDAAFWSATRTTLVGSMTPAAIRSS